VVAPVRIWLGAIKNLHREEKYRFYEWQPSEATATIAEWEEILKKLEEEISKEREKYKAELREKDNLTRELNRIIEEKDKTLEHIKQAHEKEINELKNNYERSISELKKEFENREKILRESVQARDNEINNLNSEIKKLRDSLIELERKSKQEISLLEEKSATERKSYEEKIFSLRQEIESMKTKFGQRLLSLQSEYEENERKKINAIKAAYLEEIDKLKKNIQEIITNSEREISLREEKIENVKNEFLKREKELALEYETKIKELVGIKEDLAKEIKEIQRRMEEERLLMEDKNKLLENKISTLIAEKESITNELKFAQNKIAELEATLRDYKDKLEKNNSSWEEKLLEKEQQINSLKLQLAEKDNIIKSLQLTSEEEKSKVKKVLEERLKKLGLIEGTSAPQKEKIIEKESKIQSTKGEKQAPASSTATQQTANVDNKTNIEKKVEEKEEEADSIHKAKPTKKFWSI
jgi:uncharacterized protein YukE